MLFTEMLYEDQSIVPASLRIPFGVGISCMQKFFLRNGSYNRNYLENGWCPTYNFLIIFIKVDISRYLLQILFYYSKKWSQEVTGILKKRFILL